ncbi:MAG: RNA polymerase sigma factor [Planctomycetota bacterium]|jgi:RNA polymerase sigma-70 factor (ECF subfamily)
MTGVGVYLVAEESLALDEAGFSRCCEELRPRALKFAAGMLTGDLARAEELVQEAMLRLHASRDRCRPEREDVRRYAFRILSNLCLDELRRRKTGAQALEGAGELAAGRPAVSSPDQELVRRERREAVGRAVTAMPERERAALLLREIGGQTYAQIAEGMGTTVSDVNNLIHRARQLFARLMRPWME